MKTKLGKITLILTAALVVGVVSAVYILSVRAAPVDTYQSSWQLIRAEANEDGSSFAAVYNLTTEGNFDNKDSSTVANGGPFRIIPQPGEVGTPSKTPGTKWMFAMCGKCFNDTDDTFSFDVVGWSSVNGMAQVICTGDAVLGTQAVIAYPNSGDDALGELSSETSVTYTHATNTFTVTDAGFDGVVAGMIAYVTGKNITSGYYAVTTATDANNIIMLGITSTDNNTDSTVQINPSFWADTINIDDVNTWPGIEVYNTANNSVCLLVIDLAGLEWIQFCIYDADAATSEEAGEIAVFGKPW